ncbi:L-histidine N(alpha)-methyltransferase [Streptomyces mirabilis]|uniref:L-histidine N(alpha)-methyltransferase n=1 Tax=Streptomyces mirabilis TaxID=68239 RepID=UPI0036AD83C9
MGRNTDARPFRPKSPNSAPDPTVDFAPVEALRTEISAKFRLDGMRGEPAVAGFALGRRWSDSGGRFTLSLTCPAA